MLRKKTELPGNKSVADLQIKKKSAGARGAAILLIFLVGLLGSGCSHLSAKQKLQRQEGAGLKALDQYAWSCYELGLEYMDQSRFELAHQQFSFAASSAVSKTLYEEALDGMRRAEQIIQVKR